jgi:electron transport complex protein RnfB
MGSNKMMHTVIEPWCTGCELCIPVCPVDCISLENVSGARTGWGAWSQQEADTARTRYKSHSLRHPKENAASPQTVATASPPQAEDRPALPAASPPTGKDAAERKRAVIEAALERARAKRGPAASG